MPGEKPVLSLRRLRVAFGRVVAVEDASLDVAPGEILGLTGDSGSGKSTLALALLGLTQQGGRILGGEVLIDGENLLALPEAGRRRRRGRDIALITQNPRGSLSPLHSIGAQVGATLRAHRGAGRAAAWAHAIAMLRDLGVNDPERRVHAYPHEISGGMAQRVLIAMALGAGPKLLIADEPTSGLDVTIQAAFLDTMWRRVRARGSAMLLVTQDPGILANYCDRVAVMDRGRIVETATVPAFFAAPSSAYGRSVLSLRADPPPPPAPEGPPRLQLHALTKFFPVRGSRKMVQAVDQVTLAIGSGETLGLVGESGSGKTTVGRALLRLVEPSSGAVIFDGQTVTGASRAALRRLRPHMQVVFQDPLDSLNPRWTVEDIIAEGLAPGPDRTARVASLLELVGLDPALAHAHPRALSGGDQQRVGIARSLAPDPELIVLDEPTSMLTPLARVGIIRLLRDLQAKRGLSYLFISHDLRTVEHLSHRVAVMYLGQVVEIGSRAAIFDSPLHPYSRALLGAYLAPDPTRRRVDRPDPLALAGEIPSPIDLPPGCYLAGRCPVARPDCHSTPQTLLPMPDGRFIRCLPAVEGRG
jgi:oligopeptide/dipeptide ABC transporter ATP-binding protein